LGATIFFLLKDKVAGPVRIEIADAKGTVVAELTGDGEAGLHAVRWDLQPPAPADGPVPAGEYTVRVQAGDYAAAKKLRVEAEE
jgi:flagellar hook assembly protein FlgD